MNLALKQKSDIEHYRNKLRLKAKRKGYYDFPSAEGNASSKALRHESDKAEQISPTGPSSRTPEYDDDRTSTYVKSRRLVCFDIIILLDILEFNGSMLFLYVFYINIYCGFNSLTWILQICTLELLL